MRHDLKSKFDEAFKAEFPITFEAAMRGEPKPHSDFSCAWWGFREGYRCALPTTEPVKAKGSKSWTLLIVIWACAGFFIGYKYPRDVELESTSPVEFNYQVTEDAARFLLLRDRPKCEVQP